MNKLNGKACFFRCPDILAVMKKVVESNSELISTTTTESKIFFLKMKDNYYRYLAEISTDNERQSNVLSVIEFAEESKDAYTNSFDIVQYQTTAIHAVQLALTLNSPFFIMK
ncbi:unnamed protein product [Adineta steineri]|uniref:14-3-3 domain-containing protein n=1 Tax=Adineta steineri TaxID=433720 RepID=A0A819TLX0_9BILA|nr:unnamed protein product [Adineta steineri]CAF4089871.1 unnamed protein product [Adineta steineri]